MVPVQPGCVHRTPEEPGVISSWVLPAPGASAVALTGPGLPHTSQ
jgi:hypothetical protein